MLSLKERIELLEQDLLADPPKIGMTSDLPFAVLRYEPEAEWEFRRELNLLRTRLENADKQTVAISLAELMWRSVEESEGVEALFELERRRGFAAAEEQLATYLSDPDWHPLTDLLAEELQDYDPDRTVAFLWRAGALAPAAYHLSALLEQMKGRTKVPTILCYPGSWTGSLNFMDLRDRAAPLGSYRVKIYGRQ